MSWANTDLSSFAAPKPAFNPSSEDLAPEETDGGEKAEVEDNADEPVKKDSEASVGELEQEDQESTDFVVPDHRAQVRAREKAARQLREDQRARRPADAAVENQRASASLHLLRGSALRPGAIFPTRLFQKGLEAGTLAAARGRKDQSIQSAADESWALRRNRFSISSTIQSSLLSRWTTMLTFRLRCQTKSKVKATMQLKKEEKEKEKENEEHSSIKDLPSGEQIQQAWAGKANFKRILEESKQQKFVNWENQRRRWFKN